MNKKNLRKISLYCLIIGVVLLLITYVMFHYLTDVGFTMEFQSEPGKPFVTDMVGNLATLFIFSSIFTFMFSLVFYKKD